MWEVAILASLTDSPWIRRAPHSLSRVVLRTSLEEGLGEGIAK